MKCCRYCCNPKPPLKPILKVRDSPLPQKMIMDNYIPTTVTRSHSENKDAFEAKTIVRKDSLQKIQTTVKEIL